MMSAELLAAFGKATLLGMQKDDRIRDLEKTVDQLRLDLHHRDIHVQGLTDENAHTKARLTALMEKAETVMIPVVLKPEELEPEEFDLQDLIDESMVKSKTIRPFSVQPGNPPLRL